MKTCSKCGEKRKNEFFNQDKTSDIPDWCAYCAIEFMFVEGLEKRGKR